MLHPTNGRRAPAPKTVYEVHLVIRGALDQAVRRGLVSLNVAIAGTAPKMRSIAEVEQRAKSAPELQAFLRAPAGHRLFPAMGLEPTALRCDRTLLVDRQRCDQPQRARATAFDRLFVPFVAETGSGQESIDERADHLTKVVGSDISHRGATVEQPA